MLSVFSWLRAQVKQAFVAGIQDGLAEIGDPDPDAGSVLAVLRAKAAIPVEPIEQAETADDEAAAEKKPGRRRADRHAD